MSNEKERAYFKRYKEDVKRDGKPFFPYAMFHDTVMSLVVVCVIVALACVWYFTAGEEAGDAGILGPLYTEEADPGTTSFVPRPDWYFYFLFYLLRIFKWPESVILGTVGIPTIALILLLVLPFLDRRRERRLVRRPVAVVGALLVIAKNDRHLRIEVGYGLEGALTDATTRRIIDEDITPKFKTGDFAGGVSAGFQSSPTASSSGRRPTS